MTRRISVLGATGSIGTSTLDLIRRNPDDFEVVALTAASNVDALADAALDTGADLAVIADESKYDLLKERLAGSSCRPAAGRAALVEAASGEADWVMAAIVGCAGLLPVMAAIEGGKTLALANKEALVSAGALMTAAAARHEATILPVDSEHNAIFQCLAGNSKDDVERIILTASGGPLRTWSRERMAAATPAEAIAHPNWSMGAKISVDSATLMNKGLELIEAHFLFGLPSTQIEIVVHPQSVIHSLVEFRDGSMLAQLGSADMRVPIAYTLAWPKRIETPATRLNLAELARLDFEQPDLERFPALRLARDVLEQGGAAPTVLNAANEIAVERFLAGAIGFADIAAVCERAVERLDALAPASIEEVIDLDARARQTAANLIMADCH